MGFDCAVAGTRLSLGCPLIERAYLLLWQWTCECAV
jgi:hypothetical protein